MANTEQELERTIFATIEEAIEIIRKGDMLIAVSYTHLRAHETPEHLVCRLLLEKKKN